MKDGERKGKLKLLFGNVEPGQTKLPEQAEIEQPGPTGDFPQGKLKPDDKGGLKIAMVAVDGKVIVDFGVPTKWIGFDPDSAQRFARLLFQKAQEAKR